MAEWKGYVTARLKEAALVGSAFIRLADSEKLPVQKTGGRYETSIRKPLRFRSGLCVPRTSGRRGHFT